MMCVIGRDPAAFKMAWRCAALSGPGSMIASDVEPTIYVFVPLKVKGPGFSATRRTMPGPIGDGSPYVNAMSVLKSRESKLPLSMVQERRLRIAARLAAVDGIRRSQWLRAFNPC